MTKPSIKTPAASPAPSPATSVATSVASSAATNKAPAAPGNPASPAPKSAVKSGSKSAAAKPVAATPAPAPSISRFAERFAPPRPPARGYPEPMDIVKTAHKADPKLVNAWKTKPGRDLTEAELQAMPDDVYMNDKQLDFFRSRLTILKDDLLSNAGQTTEHLREDTTIVPDPADRATIEEEHALELRTRDRERKLLKKITQSLTRIEASDYGFCDETGEPIGLGRLLARPTATLSLEAQQRREMKQKMFGD